MNWTLQLPGVTPSLNVLRDLHWARYKKMREEWFLKLRAKWGASAIPVPTGRRLVVIVRYGKRALDPDNLQGGVKPLVDALKPGRTERGVYKSGVKAGQSWVRTRLGLGLILEDDDGFLQLEVRNGRLLPGQKPYTIVTISDLP